MECDFTLGRLLEFNIPFSIETVNVQIWTAEEVKVTVEAAALVAPSDFDDVSKAG